MSFDGLVTRAVTHELQSLVGGRITKIYQPSATDLLLHVRSKGQNSRLLLSAHPTYSRMHLSEVPIENPPEPPMFCMLLRKHVEGAIVEKISQVGLERIVHLDLRGRNELGDETTCRIIVEIMGRHSNIILMDPTTGKIMDGIRRVTPAISRHRVVAPGAIYQPPPEQKKKNPLTADYHGFISSLDFNQGKLDQQLIQRFSGIGPPTAQEIIFRAGLGDRQQLWEVFSAIMSKVSNHQYEPTIAQGKKTVFAAISLTHLKNRTSYATMSTCLDAFYRDKAERDRTRQQTDSLIRRLKNEIEKNKKKIKKLQSEIKEAENAHIYRIYGELITAYMDHIQRGDQTLVAQNYYEPDAPEITIPLDPALSPSENAQRYFKRYNKAKSVSKWNNEQISQAESDNQYLESVLVQLETATYRDVDQIREELEEEGWLRPSSNRKKRRKKELPEPATFFSSEGIQILVGKNNKQNDRLTHQIASPSDTWLHTKDIPGSHVVIRAKSFGTATLHEAAMLAAYHSKARHSSKVPVDYTLVKHVHKPSGSRPGFVIYKYQQTIYVTPDEEQVHQIMRNRKG